MSKLRLVTHKEYISDIKKELNAEGLEKCIRTRCDNINDACAGTSYTTHGYVQEQLCEIMDLIRESSK